jgi:hypothetical protein
VLQREHGGKGGGRRGQTYRLDSFEVFLIDYRSSNSILDALFKIGIWFLKQIECREKKVLLEPFALVSLVVKLLALSL